MKLRYDAGLDTTIRENLVTYLQSIVSQTRDNIALAFSFRLISTTKLDTLIMKQSPRLV